MSSQTPTIGLKKPEGSDPFITEDFASNLDKIDAAFAARPAGGSGGGSGGDAATLQGHPASFFYSSANPPPTGAGGSTTDAATLQGHPASYFAVSGAVDANTLQGHPASYFYSPGNPPPAGGGGGSTYTLPGSVVQAPGRTNPKVAFSVATVTFNGVNGVNGIPIDYSSMGYAAAPVVTLTALIGSNFDMITNLQGCTAANASARMARVTGATTSATGTLHWIAIGI